MSAEENFYGATPPAVDTPIVQGLLAGNTTGLSNNPRREHACGEECRECAECRGAQARNEEFVYAIGKSTSASPRSC